MKVIAWNVAHQTKEAPIPAGLNSVLVKLAPDVLVLNEFVDGSSRESLRSDLKAMGLCNIAISQRMGRNNQVLIASKEPLTGGDLTGPETEDGAGASNFLHVMIPSKKIEIVGVRVPAYADAGTLRHYWERLCAIVRMCSQRRIVFVGDLNADPNKTIHMGGQYLAHLQREGWQIPDPAGSWSFYRGSRIDHALVSFSLLAPQAAYIAELDGTVLASNNRDIRISDHAALVLDFNE